MAIIQAAQRVLGSDWETRIATLLATIRTRLDGDYEIDEFGFDPQITEVFTAAVEPLAEKWFRLEVRGVENIPAEGGALLVANHSGTVPLDGLITGYAVKKYAGRNLRPLGADLVFSLPFVGQVARKVGATLACAEDAERLLTTGELAGVWPEGFKGIGKPYADRYKLQRFGRGGFVSSAMRAQVPIVPVSIVGAEEIYPLVGNVPSLARLLGLPYLPITPFFPLLGPLGLIPLPSKWIIEFGEPIRTDAYEPEAPTTRCCCSMSPTRYARRSSRLSTACWWTEATRSSEERAGERARRRRLRIRDGAAFAEEAVQESGNQAVVTEQAADQRIGDLREVDRRPRSPTGSSASAWCWSCRRPRWTVSGSSAWWSTRASWCRQPCRTSSARSPRSRATERRPGRSWSRVTTPARRGR